MKSPQHLYLFILGFLFTVSLQAQVLVESIFLETQTKEELSNEYGINAIYDVDLYKVLYETLDVHGALDTASGLLIVPNSIHDTYPMLTYQHGTVSERWDVPSELRGGAGLAILFGGLGYVSTAADFLGLGEARGVHPYVHADTEASAAIDLIRAAKEFATNNNVLVNDQLFITGYSQGGHAAMATHREIERNLSNEFTVTASAPMSGPYSVSDKMVDFTLGDEPYFTTAYLGWLVISYEEAYGNIYNELGDFFKPNYAPFIEQFKNEEINLITLNFLLNGQLNLNGGLFPKNMLQDSIRDIILNDVDHPINDALIDNDVFDWAPTAPTRLFYCTADDQVTFENAILANEVMNMNGATDVMAMDKGPDLGHGGCVTPATQATIDFFAQFQNIAVGIFNVEQDESLFKIQPNPANTTLFIEMDETVSFDYQLELMDVSGRKILNRLSNGDRTLTLDVSLFNKGIYFLNITSDQRSLTKKVVIE